MGENGPHTLPVLPSQTLETRSLSAAIMQPTQVVIVIIALFPAQMTAMYMETS